MTSQLLSGAMFLLLATIVLPVNDTGRAQSETEIRDLQQRQADTWNRHDATGYAALFTEDADVVNVVGWWWKGRAEIESKLTAAYAVAFLHSTLTIDDVQVRFVTPEIAIAHVRWSMQGAVMPPGIPEPRHGIQMQLLQKRDRVWRIAAFQNTTSVPEVAFRPLGPA
jgi:uncharacterized protein (TIGR02246 family)